MRSVALYLGLAASVPASAFVGYAVGYGLDHWWGTRPVFEMILAGLGFAGGIVEVVRRMPRD